MTALSAATIAATTSAAQKLWMSTPGRTHAATINATPVASHEMTSGNTLKLGRSGCQEVEWPYFGSWSLGIGFLSKGRMRRFHRVVVVSLP